MAIPPEDEHGHRHGHGHGHGQETVQPAASAGALHKEPRRGRNARKATASLVLAVLAPASMIITAPMAMFAMLATYPSEGPSPMPWVTPLVFFSLPLLLALPSLAQALFVVKAEPRTSQSRSSASTALIISGLVFALALGPGLDQLVGP